MRTPAENEQFVRSHWERVGIDHYRIDGVRYWMVHQNGRGIPLHGYESPELAWSAAAEFTERRMEEIRQVEAEIDAVIYWLDNATLKAAPKRILAREQAALESLKKGWIA